MKSSDSCDEPMWPGNDEVYVHHLATGGELANYSAAGKGAIGDGSRTPIQLPTFT